MKLSDKIAGFSRTDLSIDRFELHLVRETQAVKVHQSHYVLPLVIIVALVYVFSLWNDAPRFQLVVWESLIVLAACFRAYICNRIEKHLGKAEIQELYSNELWLFYTSFFSTFVIGSGFWWICIDGTDRTVFAVTLLCCMYAIGTTINSSVRFNNFPVLLLANLGQGILFLSGIGRSPNPEVSAALISISLILIQFGRKNSQVFTDSIRIRDKIRKQNLKLENDKNIVEQALTSEQQAKALAIEANEDKSRFLAAASHDLRQPLHAMGFFLASLKKNISSEKAMQIVDEIEETSDALKGQFSSLLELSKLDSGAVEAQFAEFRLDTLLHSLVKSVHQDALKKGLYVALETEPLSVNSDKLLLERVIRNLLLNAIRYTEIGSISVATECVTAGVRLRISDTGPGIAPKDKEKIFDDFFQTDNPARSPGEGSGLGLAIVRRISPLLRLDIQLESTLGEGTTFDILIPDVSSIKQQMPIEVGPDRGHSLDAAIENLNILIVDDDPRILEAISSLIETWRCRPYAATSAQEARDILQRIPEIDFAIVDDMLGKHESGLELADYLSTKLSNQPIIVTGNVLPQRLQEIRRHGFRVFQKPMGPRELQDAIASRANRQTPMRESGSTSN